MSSPRAQQAAARHYQVNKTTSPSGFTGLTVSTLTTGNTVQTALDDEEDVDFLGGGAGGFDEEVEEVLLPPLPPLKSIFECAYVQLTQSGWECRWCGKSFIGKHSTRALNHVMKMSNNDVGVCQSVITDKYLQQYQALSLLLSQRSAARKRSHEEKHDSVAISQDASVATLLAQRGVMVSLPPSVRTVVLNPPFQHSLSMMEGVHGSWMTAA